MLTDVAVVFVLVCNIVDRFIQMCNEIIDSTKWVLPVLLLLMLLMLVVHLSTSMMSVSRYCFIGMMLIRDIVRIGHFIYIRCMLLHWERKGSRNQFAALIIIIIIIPIIAVRVDMSEVWRIWSDDGLSVRWDVLLCSIADVAVDVIVIVTATADGTLVVHGDEIMN